MASYLRRHGGLTSRELRTTKSMRAREVHRRMKSKRHSSKEDWRDPHTAGFWARHLLWSEPSLASAARHTAAVTSTLSHVTVKSR